MNANEIKQCHERLQTLQQIDLPKLLSEAFPEQDISTVQVGGISANRLVSLVRRIAAHFEGALEDEPELLPRQQRGCASNGQPTNFDVVSELQNLGSFLTARNWTEAVTRATLLAQYLMNYGQWQKTQRKLHAVYEKRASELLGEAELKVKQLQSGLESLRAQKEELLKLIKDQRVELDEASIELKAAKGNRQRISDLLQDANNEQGQLSTILQTQSTNLDATTSELNEVKKTKSALEQALKEAKEFYSKAKADADWVFDKKSDIDRLTGGAADGSLGGTFRTRKEELESSAKTWRTITVLATIAAAAYVPVAFTLIPPPQGNDWLVLLANLGKLAPVVLFLGFVLRQYSRERSFLEEYAFKTSVAFVVNAYADQIAHQKFEKTIADFADDQVAWESYVEKRESERKKLIKETVDRLFTPPQIHAQKEPSLIAFRPKTAADIFREARELIKEAKTP